MNEQDLIRQLVEALRPFAQLMENPHEWIVKKMHPENIFEAFVDAQDVATAQDVLADGIAFLDEYHNAND